MNTFPICAKAVMVFAVAMSLAGGERGYLKAVLIDGPLVFYRFNEGHLSASATDMSTHARHGQYLGPGLSFLETVTGTDAAVRFSGGVVRIASSHALNPASLSLEAVLLWRGPGATLDCIFDKTTPSGDPLYRFCVQNDGVLQFAVRTHQNMSLLSKSKVPFNVPAHVTATCGSTGLKIYINGTLDASLNQIVGALGSGSSEAVSIGSGFAGSIDEAAIYSHVLSAARIASHAQAVGKLGPAEEVAPLTCFRVNSFALTPEVSVQLAGSYTVSGCRRSPASMSKVWARLTVDNVSYTVPNGGFHQQSNGWWIYSSPQAWALRIHPKNRQWQLTSNSASGIKPPNVGVRLELDGEAGVDRIKATPANGHWSYAAGKQACQSQPSMQRISSTRLLVHAPSSPLSAEASFPVQFGVPFGRKELQSSRFARVRDAGGQLVASQTKVLGFWNGPDAAEGIRWLQVSFDALVSATHYTLEYGPCAAFGSPPPGIQVTSSATGVTVNTGPLQFVVNRSKPAVIHSARFDIDGDGQFSQDEVVVQDTGPNGLFTKDHNGSEYRSELDTNATLEVEEVGPHQVTLKATGEYISSGDGTPLNRWIVRMKAYAGKPYVRVYHTFVITEGGSARQFQDIGLEIQLAPDDDRTITFSGGTLPVVGADLPEPVHNSENHHFMAASHGALMLHQQSHKQYALYDSGTAIETKEQRSGHWFGAFGKTFGAAVAVRWFWQNYPGALEWTKTGLRVHFYKSVGLQKLDFRPEQYLRSRGASPGPSGPGQWDVFKQHISYVCERSHEYPRRVCFDERALHSDCDGNEIIDNPQVCGQMRATGVGVAKTHELLLMFGPGNSSSVMAERSHVLQKPLLVQVDPDRLRTTEALGRLHPRDIKRFAGVEKALGLYMDRMRQDQSDLAITATEYGDSYGLLDFGDVLHSTKQAHRYWAHMFYVQPSVWWTLFARSGDRRFFEFGEANARHHMDVDISHLPDGPQIVTGSYANDDAGLIHWANHETAPQSTTAHVIPYLTAYYYQTGYERALDVALEAGVMFRDRSPRNPTWQGRASGVALWAATELYRLTWRPEFKAFADGLKERIVNAVLDLCVRKGDGGCAATFSVNTGNADKTSFDPAPDAPADFSLAYLFAGAIAYHQQTGDSKILDWIIQQASYLHRSRNIANMGTTFTVWDGLAYAYHHTGKSDLLREAKFALNQIGKHDDYMDISAGILDRVWWMFKAPYLMDALVAAGEASPKPVRPLAPAESTAGRILVLSEGKPFHLEVRMKRLSVNDPSVTFGTHEQAAKASLVLYAPDHTKVATRPFPVPNESDKWNWYFEGGWIEAFDIAAAVTGIYTLVVEQPDAPVFQIYLIRNSLNKAMFEVGTGDGVSPGYRYAAGKQYVFFVPAATSELEFTFTHPAKGYCDFFEFTLTDPFEVDQVIRPFACPDPPPVVQGQESYIITAPKVGLWTVNLGSNYGTPDPGKGYPDVQRELRRFTIKGIRPAGAMGAFFGEAVPSAFAPVTP